MVLKTSNECLICSTEEPDTEQLEALFYDLFRDPRIPIPADTRSREATSLIQDRVQEARNETRSGAYLAEFVDEVREDAILLGAVRLSEARQAEDEQLVAQREEQRRLEQQYTRRREVTHLRTSQALAREHEQLDSQLSREAALDRRREELFRRQKKQLEGAFDRAERQLNAALEERIHDMSQLYGPFNTQAERRADKMIDWDAMPQRVRVGIKMIRAVREKLPTGDYVCMCTIFDHLGGHPLPMSKMRQESMFAKKKVGGDEVQCEQTVPIRFPVDLTAVNARVEMKFDSDLHFVCPARDAIRPSMVFIFEIVLLAPGEDVVVGWGCFPLCDSFFNIVKGSFKMPLLRGPVDLSIDKHEVFMKRYMDDIDSWLVNMYITVQPEDRITATGVREHDTELQHSSRVLGYPTRRTKTPRTGRPGLESSSGTCLIIFPSLCMHGLFVRCVSLF